jgi:hypothetical protein
MGQILTTKNLQEKNMASKGALQYRFLTRTLVSLGREPAVLANHHREPAILTNVWSERHKDY